MCLQVYEFIDHILELLPCESQSIPNFSSAAPSQKFKKLEFCEYVH